jgi:hypothetical protein
LSLQTRQRRRVVGKALETAQFAERLVDLDALVDGDVNAVDVDRGDLELRLLLVLPQAVHEVVASRHALSERVLPERRQPVAVQLGSCLGKVSERLHHGSLRFVDLVKHGLKARPVVAVQYST